MQTSGAAQIRFSERIAVTCTSRLGTDRGWDAPYATIENFFALDVIHRSNFEARKDGQ